VTYLESRAHLHLALVDIDEVALIILVNQVFCFVPFVYLIVVAVTLYLCL